jgi:hypothetical protein
MAEYTLNQLKHTHLAMVEMCVQGASPRDVADATGYNIVTVRQLIRAPLFQNELAKRRGQQQRVVDKVSAEKLTRAKQVLVDNVEKAAGVQVGLLNSVDERVQQTAVTNIFDRVFGRSGEKQQASIQVTLGAGALLTLQTALAEDTSEAVDSNIIDGQLVGELSSGHDDADQLLTIADGQTV